MKPLVIFDLDGPLLEGRERHHACYQDILQKAGFEPLPLNEYWRLRRAMVPVPAVLERSGAAGYQSEFRRLWLEQIEAEPLLALDRLQSGALQLLRQLTDSGHASVIATLRQHPDRALRQLQRLGIRELVEDVLVVPHAEGAPGKAQRVLQHARLRDQSPRFWVGDTEVDAAAAALVGVPCFLVTTGIRTAEFLRGLGAAGVFDALDEIPSFGQSVSPLSP